MKIFFMLPIMYLVHGFTCNYILIIIKNISEYKLDIQMKDSIREFMYPDTSDGLKFGLNGEAGEVRMVPLFDEVNGNVTISSGSFLEIIH